MSEALHLEDFSDTELRCKSAAAADRLCTMGVGGPISLLLEPHSIEATQEVVRRLQCESAPFRVLGAGSNVILPDAGLDEAVIRFGRSFSSWSLVPEDSSLYSVESCIAEAANRSLFEPGSSLTQVFALAGTPVMALSRQLSAIGLSGMEFAAGIPGSLGGAVRMNAGAHGNSISSAVQEVLVLEKDGSLCVYPNEKLEFAYRSSTLEDDQLILAASLRLMCEEVEVVAKRRAEALAYRKATQPLHLPSSGSVFKNPNKEQFAASLIESCGLKGRSRGNIEFSTMHANWLVRQGAPGRAEDCQALIRLAQEEVAQRFAVKLESEVILW